MDCLSQRRDRDYANDSPRKQSFQRGLLKELAAYPHFVVWKSQDIDSTPHKPPYSPSHPRLADTTDPKSWGTLDEALQALATSYYDRETKRREWFQGIGFVFAEDDPYAAMDLDHCVGTNRSINKRERDIISFLSSHTHYSPRDGAHVIFEIDKARFPGQNRKAGNVEFFKVTTTSPSLLTSCQTHPQPLRNGMSRRLTSTCLFFPANQGRRRGTRGGR